MTGSVARIVMDTWGDKMEVAMADNGVKKYMMIKYVDDVDLLIESIGLGTRWVGDRTGKTEYRDEWTEEDRETGKTESVVTMEVIKNLSRSCSRWMEFTVDSEDNHLDGRVPMLDLCVWKSGPNTIHHGFYEKPMMSGLVILEKSASSQGGKMATLAQEIIRRMRNTGRDVPVEERIKYMDKYMWKLRDSGYSETVRLEIFRSGLQGYYKMVAKEFRGGPINRDSRVNRASKKINKMKKAETWYCPEKKEEE